MGTVAQSICTHYSCFENMGWFGDPEKNQVQNMDLKKAGCKKRGQCYSKREEAAWSDFLKVPNPKKYQIDLGAD